MVNQEPPQDIPEDHWLRYVFFTKEWDPLECLNDVKVEDIFRDGYSPRDAKENVSRVLFGSNPSLFHEAHACNTLIDVIHLVGEQNREAKRREDSKASTAAINKVLDAIDEWEKSGVARGYEERRARVIGKRIFRGCRKGQKRLYDDIAAAVFFAIALESIVYKRAETLGFEPKKRKHGVAGIIANYLQNQSPELLMLPDGSPDVRLRFRAKDMPSFRTRKSEIKNSLGKGGCVPDPLRTLDDYFPGALALWIHS